MQWEGKAAGLYEGVSDSVSTSDTGEKGEQGRNSNCIAGC